MSHWGELPILEHDIDSGIAAIEREQMTKLRPINIQGPGIFLPQSYEDPKILHGDSFEKENLSEHTIKLIQYSKRMKMHIQSMQHQKEHMSDGDSKIDYVPAQSVPECTEGCQIKNIPSSTIPFLPSKVSDDIYQKQYQSNCTFATVRPLLKKSVATIFSHAGYENCSESTLDTVTDIAGEYMTQITKLLRVAVDAEALSGSTGFEDPIEQMFNEIGIGSTTNLHNFYTTRIVNYHNNMIVLCWQLFHDYEQLRLSPTKPKVNLKPKEKKREESVSVEPLPESVDESSHSDDESDSPME